MRHKAQGDAGTGGVGWVCWLHGDSAPGAAPAASQEEKCEDFRWVRMAQR